VQAALAAALAVCAGVVLSATPLIPSDHTVPMVIGAGSDMDNQLEMGWAAIDYGPWGIPHWDPAPDFGQPLFANPEAFVSHPGFIVGAAISESPLGGLRVLYAVQVAVLLLGCAWLGVELGLPWWLGMLCGLPLLASDEWRQRVAQGHFMALGVTAWPALFAGVLRGLRASGAGAIVFAAAPGGLALGLAFTGGAHYPTILGIFLVLCIVWLRVAGPWFGLALLASCALPFALSPGGRELPTLPSELIFAAIVAAGLYQGRAHLRGAATVLAGIAVGVIAGGGSKLLPAWLVISWSGRTQYPWNAQAVPVDLTGFWSMASRGGGVDLPLWFFSELTLPLLFLGVLLLAVYHLADRVEDRPPDAPGLWLALAAAVAIALAYGAGRPLTPWRAVAFSPAMASIDFPIRLQWILLIVPCFGLCAAGQGVARRIGGPWAGLAAAVIAAGLLLRGLDATPLPPLYEEDTAPPRTVDVKGISDHGALVHGDQAETLVGASGKGLVRPSVGTGIKFGPIPRPFEPGPVLARVIEGDDSSPLVVTGRTNRWTVTGPPGATVEIAQRELHAWRCEPELTAEDVAWLTVTLGSDGRAECVYRTKGLLLGLLAQLLALAGIVVLGRRASAPGAAARP